MIAVIADDLTGAAEIGGIGLRFGLTVEISTEVDLTSKADLLIISADTRSKSENEAVEEMAKYTEDILSIRPKLIYKKVDSVLRGHVIPELKAHLKALKLTGTYLIPANPALGRTIESGICFIDGRPIENTPFKDDPEFPAKSSDILKMLSAKDIGVSVNKHFERSDGKGIIVGETSSPEDLKAWAIQLKGMYFIAGGASFFSELLIALKIGQSVNPPATRHFSGNKLYVSGTAFTGSSARIATLIGHKGLVNYQPSVLLSPRSKQQDIHKFALRVSKQVSTNGTAIIAIHPGRRSKSDIAGLQLRERTALIVYDIFQNVQISELIIEGGSTAASILALLGIDKLFPTNDYAPGVIRSKAEGKENLYVTLKPGSYNWPAEIWDSEMTLKPTC